MLKEVPESDISVYHFIAMVITVNDQYSFFILITNSLYRSSSEVSL